LIFLEFVLLAKVHS